MTTFLSKLFSHDPVAHLHFLVEEINKLEPEFEKKSQEDLRKLTVEWQKELQEVQKGIAKEQAPDDLDAAIEFEKERKRKLKREMEARLRKILPQAFAAVREAAKRTLAQRHFNVQLIGGMILNEGKIAEMKTGEGKTLSATTSVYLNALAGRGVHLVTVNDYLARRDASWMGQVYDYLGLTIGTIQHDKSFRFQMEAKAAEAAEPRAGEETEAISVQLDVRNLTPCARREAYFCDITYGTNNEFGFDYLRDNMVADSAQKVQRDLYYAIVDEVDSILIDEARTPLIISAPDTAPTDEYYQFSKVVEQLNPDEDFKVDEKKKSAALTEEGIAHVEKILGVENIYVEKGIATVHHMEQALRARTLFRLDRDYVVRPGESGQPEIVIVDEFTGRLLPGRRYSEGLHQAIEAKENVPVQRESKTLATITFQNYFRLYTKIAGMTGTAMTEAEEFQKIYGLEPVEIPTHRPMIRQDEQDQVFKNEKGKFEALAREVRERYQCGQPVLIGTVSIEKNELISTVLTRAGVPHQVLNAKNHEQEARIIAQAGRAKAITLATNIAGRGVDIILGGSPYVEEEAEKVRKVGGLHVLGTERHESRRIDNQLRGRSGRQGDPGSTQFYVSLEDDLTRLFGGERVQKMMTTMGIPDDMPIAHGLVSRVIESAQKKIEGLNFDVRKHVLEFDDVMNKQREVIYRIRNRVLAPDAELKEDVLQKVEKEVRSIILTHTSGYPEEWNNEEIYKQLAAIFPYDIHDAKAFADTERYAEYFVSLARMVYDEKEVHLSTLVMRQIERIVMLQSIDNLWMEHLDTMDHLRSSVRLRGYAQRDPLIEYKREGFELFQRMLFEIDKQIVYSIYHVEMKSAPAMNAAPANMMFSSSSAPRQQTAPQPGIAGVKIGRNDPCPCGSGKKYKKCGMLNTPEHQKNIAGNSSQDRQQRIGG